MKGLLFFGALALLAFVSCKEDNVEPEPEPVTGYDEAWYAANATISSSDAHFAITDEGGEISFKAEGGSVVVYVDCGTEWTAENSAAGVFGCDVQSASITVTADQNLVEEELYGTITLMTAESKILFATITVTQNAYGAPEITVEANEWHVPAVVATAEELTTEIRVEANEEWSIECDAEWLTAEKGENSVSLTAAENETLEERVAEVVLTCTDGYNSDSETITVTQDARAYITLSAEEFEFDKMGGEDEVTVESNYEWSYEYESDWFTVSEGTDGSLTITVDVNRTGDDREGTVTFTAGDGAANVAETTLSITQSIEDPDVDLSKITVHSAKDLQAAVKAGYSEITVSAGDAGSLNLELDSYLEFNYDCTLNIEEGVTITGPDATTDVWIDHNGTEEQYCSVIYVNGGNLTINGSGTVATSGTNSSYYTNAIWVVNGSVTVNGGTFKGSHWNDTADSETVWAKHAVYCGEGGKAYLYGGNYSAGNTIVNGTIRGGHALNIHNASYEDGSAMIYCYGGAYYRFDPSAPDTDDASSYVAEGYRVVRYEDVDGKSISDTGNWYHVKIK